MDFAFQKSFSPGAFLRCGKMEPLSSMPFWWDRGIATAFQPEKAQRGYVIWPEEKARREFIEGSAKYAFQEDAEEEKSKVTIEGCASRSGKERCFENHGKESGRSSTWWNLDQLTVPWLVWRQPRTMVEELSHCDRSLSGRDGARGEKESQRVIQGEHIAAQCQDAKRR